MNETAVQTQTPGQETGAQGIGQDTRPAAVTPETGTPETGGAQPASPEGWTEDAILPEGWKEGDDFPLPVPFADVPQGLIGDKGEPGEPGVPDAGNSVENAPDAASDRGRPTDAGGQTGDAAPPSAQDAAQKDAPAGDAPPDYEVLYKAEMARQEVERERQNAEKYRAIYRNLTENEGVNESLAKLAAANECGGKNYPLEEPAPAGAAESGPGTAGVDIAAAVRSIHQQFPDAREMPPDVTEAILQGRDPVTAYTASRLKSFESESARLREENARLRAQMDTIRRAPVRGVSGTDTRQSAQDPFEQGFDSDSW